MRPCSGKIKDTVLVDIEHRPRLDIPVGAGVLDNAQRIDPNISYSEGSGSAEGVLEGGGEF